MTPQKVFLVGKRNELFFKVLLVALQKLDQEVDRLVRPGSGQSCQSFQKDRDDGRIEVLTRRQARDVDFGLLGVRVALIGAAGRPLLADVGFHFAVVVVAAAAGVVVVGF